MPDPQVAQQAAPSAWTAFWGFLGTVGSLAAAWIGRRAWSWHRSRPARVTKEDLTLIREQNAEIMESLSELRKSLAELRKGQEERGRQMAVLEATMATRDNLNEVMGVFADRIEGQVTHVNERLDKHLDNHPQKAA